MITPKQAALSSFAEEQARYSNLGYGPGCKPWFFTRALLLRLMEKR